MSDHDPTLSKLKYASSRVLNRDVLAMRRATWEHLVNGDGSPTLMNEPPEPVKGVMQEAMVVAVAASGQMNPDPGFDIVRYDPNDAPHIYNVDHYKVLENLAIHPEYDTIRNTAGVRQSEELTNCLNNHVFVVRNEESETPDHWSKDLPDRIKIARHKTT
jgi:hypothetical protein